MFKLFDIEDDNCKVAVILIICAAIVAMVCTFIASTSEKKYIESGYSKTTLMGSSTAHWVKD